MSAGSSARPVAARRAEVTVRARLRSAGFAAALIAVVGCAGLGGSPATVSQPSAAQQPVAGQWVVDTREHVDLWLHAFALLQGDSTRVPYFRRGYRDSVVARRKRENVVSMIAVNREKLASRFLAFPNLVSAQF